MNCDTRDDVAMRRCGDDSSVYLPPRSTERRLTETSEKFVRSNKHGGDDGTEVLLRRTLRRFYDETELTIMGCLTSRHDGVYLSSAISVLTSDSLLCIFSYLSTRERCRLARVCRYWRRLTTEHPTLWRDIDVTSYEVNLHRNWTFIKCRFTPALKSLRIGSEQHKSTNCGITRTVLHEIAERCPELEDLEIRGALLRNTDASDMPSSLQRLVIHRCDIPINTWCGAAFKSGALQKLRHLDLDLSLCRQQETANQFTKDVLQCVSNLTHLAFRNLNTIVDFKLKELPLTLTELCFWNCNLPRRWFDSGLPAETELKINKLTLEVKRHFSWTTLCSIGCISSLSELCIIGADLRALDSDQLPSSLRKLILRQVWMTNRWFQSAVVAGNLQELEHLELIKLRSFSQKCAKDFSALSNLKYLYVCKSHIDDTGMAYAVGHLSSLESLTIKDSSITDVSIALLCQNVSTLKQLRLRHCGVVTDVGVLCIEHLKSIELLEIIDCPGVSGDAVVNLAGSLKRLRHIIVTGDVLEVEDCHELLYDYNIQLQVLKNVL